MLIVRVVVPTSKYGHLIITSPKQAKQINFVCFIIVNDSMFPSIQSDNLEFDALFSDL